MHPGYRTVPCRQDTKRPPHPWQWYACGATMTDENDLEAPEFDRAAEAVWTAGIQRRARQIAATEAELIDAEDVHAEVTARLRAQAERAIRKG